MHFIDTHIHLQDFKNVSYSETVSHMQNMGIQKCICVSACEEDWEKVIELYQLYPNFITPAFGIHPWYIAETMPGWQGRLEKLLQKFPGALIGECGLDRLRNSSFESQAEPFLFQIQMAKHYQRALLIHAVKAQEWLENLWHILPETFVFHSFNGRLEFLKKILNYGGYAAFNSKILKNKTKIEILRTVPTNRILLETDAPYQSMPKDLPMLAEKIAEIRNNNLENLAQIIFNNSLEIISHEK